MDGRTGRYRGAGVPDDVVHQEKWRLAFGLLDTLVDWQMKALWLPMSAPASAPLFRLGLDA